MPEEEFKPLFEVVTPLGFTVRTSPHYWLKIIAKHPDLKDRLEVVKQTLSSPSEIRQSSRDERVLLFYAREDAYWVVAVARRLNEDGFLVTAYRADAIKEGERLWPR
jgi:hypothetical protein